MTGDGGAIVHARGARPSRGGGIACAVIALVLASCGSGPDPLALQFEGLEGWTRFDRGVDVVPPLHPEGHSLVYVDRLPAHGDTAFAEGTHIVRITTLGDDVTQWEAHAMVKREPTFNADGARGWEYYDLRFTRDAAGALHASIVWHGVGPSDAGGGYGLPDGGSVFGCNHCHASATWNDSVLGDELDLTTF